MVVYPLPIPAYMVVLNHRSQAIARRCNPFTSPVPAAVHVPDLEGHLFIQLFGESHHLPSVQEPPDRIDPKVQTPR